MDRQGRQDRIEVCEDGALTINQAVEFSGLSRRTLYNLMDAGKLPYSMAPGVRRRLIPRRSLVEYLAGGLIGGGFRGERRGDGPMLVVQARAVRNHATTN